MWTCQFGITVDDNTDDPEIPRPRRKVKSIQQNQLCLFSKSDLSPQEGEHVKLSDSTCNHFPAHLLRTAPVTNFLTPVTLKVIRGHRSPYCSCWSCEQWSCFELPVLIFFVCAQLVARGSCVISFICDVVLFFPGMISDVRYLCQNATCKKCTTFNKWHFKTLDFFAFWHLSRKYWPLIPT